MGGGGIHDYINDDTFTSIMKTTNKGNTWENIYLSQNSFNSIFNIYFKDTIKGWAVGSNPYSHLILYTTNSGETWEEQELPNLTNWYGNTDIASIIYSIEFANDTLGWLTCAGEYGSGYILLTTDAGETWEQQYVNRNLNEPIYDICAVDENNAWAVGADYIYHNSNADTLIIVGTEEIENENLYISPNPTSGIFTIKSNISHLSSNISITDITGKQIYNSHISTFSNFQIDISNQPKGIYFITIQYNSNNKTNFLTQKIIKL